MRVIGVRKELDFPHSLWNLFRTPTLPEQSNSTIDQWRADRTLLDRQQLVRAHLEISKREGSTGVHLKPRAVAVVPRGRWMNGDGDRQINFGGSTQGLIENLCLDFKLMFVARVLVVASAA